MDSWHNGREELLQQLAKVYDQIGTNIQAELEDENVVRINREELRLLRENSANVGRFAENNARLSDELEKCRAAVSRVDELEKENKRLAAELQKQLTRQEEATVVQAPTTARPTPKSTPIPNDPPSSVAQIEGDETNSISLERYQRLSKKYNTSKDQYEVIKVARQTLEDRLRAVQEKNKEWNAFKEQSDKALVKKDEKIKRLEAELVNLRGHIQEKINGGIGPGILPAPAPDAMLLEQAKETVREQIPIGLPASSPIKASTLPSAAADNHEEEQTHVDGGVTNATEDADSVELPQHRANVRLVEETRFDALEAHHSSSTEGEPDVTPIQGTAEEEASDPDLLRESPHETPVVTSCRSIKKRKSTHKPTEEAPMRSVKVELISSSPIGLAHFLPLDESIDLDDIGEKVDTPRKHRQIQLASQRVSIHTGKTSVQRTPGHETSETSNGAVSKRTGSVLQSRSTNQQILPRTADDRALKKRRLPSNNDVNTLMEDGELVTPARKQIGSNEDGRLLELLSKPSPQRQALSPTATHPNQQTKTSALSTATSGLAVEIIRLPPQDSDYQRIFATGDTNASGQTGNHFTTTPRPTSKDSTTGKLDSDKPVSRDTTRSSAEPPRSVSIGSNGGSISPTSSPTKAVTPMTSPSNDFGLTPRIIGLPPRRDLQAIFTPKPPAPKVSKALSTPKPANGMTSALKSGRTKMNMTREEWELDPDHEPLRLRPLNKLRLQDFKINKNYNQGADYAFREVVRGHARNRLEACTKPGCCGDKFRKMAELTTVEEPTLSQEERDDELLRKFMGDNAHKLPNFGDSERRELLMQAKTRDLSYTLGRHRHAYNRQSSPPGFWRTDFPTTQEEMADQEEAKELERATILQRYNEAMRPGGRFIFRDE